MRFIHNLLPLLNAATTSTPNFSRSVSVLSGGKEGAINLSDLDLKTTFSLARCAAHTITMNSLMTTEFAKRNPRISFVHSYPSGVNTGIARELPLWARMLTKAVTPFLSPFLVSAADTGARQHCNEWDLPTS
jgi:hypothetical protein